MYSQFMMHGQKNIKNLRGHDM